MPSGGVVSHTLKALISTDGDVPYLLINSTNEIPTPRYPSLIGDQGDTLTTDGTAILLFGATNTVSWGKPLWSVKVDFS